MSTPGQAVSTQNQPAQAQTSSTTAAPSSTPPIHQAWYARAATWFVNVAKHVKSAVLKVAEEVPKVDAALKEYAPTIEALSNLALPGSGNIEAHLIDVWSAAASAVKAAGDAAGANAVNVTLDAQLVAQIKEILPAVEQFLHPQAGPAAPAN